MSLSGELGPKTAEATLITVEKKGKKESLVILPWPDDGQAHGSFHPADLDLRAQIRSGWRWKLSLETSFSAVLQVQAAFLLPPHPIQNNFPYWCNGTEAPYDDGCDAFEFWEH
jgi:hypothetical protein